MLSNTCFAHSRHPFPSMPRGMGHSLPRPSRPFFHSTTWANTFLALRSWPSAPGPLLPLPISSASSCYSTTLCQPHFLARPVHHFLCPPLPSLRPTFAPSHHPPLTVNGLAVGGHANVALANYFDIVFASSKARFKYPFVKLGLTPELGRYVCVCVCVCVCRMD